MAARSKTAKRESKGKTPEHRVALFVEGVTRLTGEGRDDLRELWRYQCARVSDFPPELLEVHGFSKQQILLLDPAHGSLRGAGKVPLDVAIELSWRQTHFQSLIVAFDAYPPNQAIELIKGQKSPCLKLERNFLLERLAQSAILPRKLREAADRLCAHYAANPGRERPRARPPLGEVEIIYMEPTFESLLVADEAALRRLFGLKSTPNSWPRGNRPEHLLPKIVDEHRHVGPKYLRGPFKSAKHAWAQEILRNANDDSPIWRHAIAARLKKVLPAVQRPLHRS